MLFPDLPLRVYGLRPYLRECSAATGSVQKILFLLLSVLRDLDRMLLNGWFIPAGNIMLVKLAFLINLVFIVIIHLENTLFALLDGHCRL